VKPGIGMTGLVAAVLALVPGPPPSALRYSPVPRDGAPPGRCPSQPPKPGPEIAGLTERKLPGFVGGDPPPDQEHNWLPVPGAGMPQPFLRAYSLRDQAWNPPPIVAT
jgi:hypothetical protein